MFGLGRDKITKWLSIVLIGAILGTVLLVAFAGSGCAPTPTPVATPTKPAAPPAPLKLTVASHVPPSYEDIFIPMKTWVDDINTMGKGKVKIDFYHSGTLLKVKELIPGLERGTADIIFLTTSHCTGAWPIIGGISLPFIWKSAMDAHLKLKMESPLYNYINEIMVKKYGVLWLANGMLPLEYIWTAKKPIKTPADMKGMKLRVGGEVEAKAVKALGGSPVFMPSAELYEALHRGTIDGVICYPGTIAGRKLEEVIKYAIKVPVGAYGYSLWVKKDTWDKLPEDVQRIIWVASAKYDYLNLDYALKVHKEKSWPRFKEAGMEIIEVSPEVIAKYREICKPIWDEWAKSVGPEVGEGFIELARE